jgi:serine/threonine protein kinase/tetratricopeptide (TPR) repeat protein
MSEAFDALRRRLAPEYVIEGELGRGGMAVVFRARDVRHDRTVAIKVMRPELSAMLGRDRFLQEIRMAARLAHPRIVAVFDSGDSDGVLYYVMPFVDAETLRQLLEKHPRLPVRQAVGIARDVARALAYAHHHGVIHRDIKPENIMLPGGEAVVTDFGVAVARAGSGADSGAERLTEPGLVLGTPTYMSPDQAFGEAREAADVYSLGCVLFEMLAGKPPYEAPSPVAVMARHSTAPIPSPERPDAPQGVLAALRRSMAKSPQERPTAADFEEMLRKAIEEPGVLHTTPTDLTTPPSARAIAVLPFADLSPGKELEYLCDGIAEELLDALSRLPTLRVASRTSAFALRDSGIDVREKASRLGVEAVLEGSVRAAGGRMRVAVQLINGLDGFQIWSQRFDAGLEEVFEVEDRIARAVVEALEVKLATPLSTMVAPATADVESHREYLLGRQALNRRTGSAISESLERFAASSVHDPQFAPAHAAVAEARVLQAVYGVAEPAVAMEAARASADQALALAPHLGAALAARGSVRAMYDWKWMEAERDFVTAIERNPGYATARQWYAMHLLAPLGRVADARAELERARASDPLSSAVASSLGQIALFAGDATEAVRRQRKVLESDPSFGPGHLFLGQALLAAGDAGDALASLRRAAELTDRSSEVLAFLAHATAATGDRAGAEAIGRELAGRAESGYLSPVVLAVVQLGMGNASASLDALEAAAEIRATDLVWVGVRPVFAGLKAEPRFGALLRRLGLASEGA